MNYITRYMLKQVIVVTIFVTMILCFAIWLTQSLRLVDLIINRGLPLSMFLYLALLLLPRFLAIVLPIAVFCATIFTYNRLSSDSELVVLRSAGLSQFAIAKPGLIAAALTSFLMVFLNLYLLPASYREFKDLQFAIRNDYSSILLQEGVFNTLGDNVTVFIRERNSAGELHGILVHDSRNAEQQITMMAERGAIVQSEQGPRVILVNGNRQHVDRDKGELSLLYFDRYVVEISADEGPKYVRWRDPRERYLPELLFPGDTADERHQRNKLIAEGHNRISMLILPLTYCAIGLALLMSAPFNRRGQLRITIVTVLIVSLIAVGHISLHNLAGRHLGFVPALYILAIVPLLGALYMLSSRHPRSIPTLVSTA
jgi:lipopolysaccharide export system permease protein